jgi:hypothetical protein
VSELTGRAHTAATELPVDDDAATDAGAQGQHDHVQGSAAGAEAVLG